MKKTIKIIELFTGFRLYFVVEVKEMSKDFRRRLFEKYTREQLIDMLINEKIKSDNYKTSINNLVKQLKEKDEIINKARSDVK